MHIPTPRPAPRYAQLLGWVAAALILLAVFAMYTVPGFMVMLADQLWACF